MVRRNKKNKPLSKAARRAQKLPTSELASWLDHSVIALGQACDQWRYHSGPIKEVQKVLEAVNALVEEAANRV